MTSGTRGGVVAENWSPDVAKTLLAVVQHRNRLSIAYWKSPNLLHPGCTCCWVETASIIQKMHFHVVACARTSKSISGNRFRQVAHRAVDMIFLEVQSDVLP